MYQFVSITKILDSIRSCNSPLEVLDAIETQRNKETIYMNFREAWDRSPSGLGLGLMRPSDTRNSFCSKTGKET